MSAPFTDLCIHQISAELVLCARTEQGVGVQEDMESGVLPAFRGLVLQQTEQRSGRRGSQCMKLSWRRVTGSYGAKEQNPIFY